MLEERLQLVLWVRPEGPEAEQRRGGNSTEEADRHLRGAPLEECGQH